MDDTNTVEIQQWMLKARHDIESAKLLLAGKDAWRLTPASLTSVVECY